MSHVSCPQRSRSIITFFIVLSTLTVLIVVFTFQAHGDDGPEGPPAPSVPTYDPVLIAAGEATKTAVDAEEEAEQESARATEVRSEELGTPSAKTLSPVSAPPPMSVATVEAGTMERPGDGISIVQSAPGGWIGRYRITNMWYGTIGGNQVYLYAGAKLNVPNVLNSGSSDVGMILYTAMGVTADAEYLTGPNHGDLTFTSSDGDCLTLTETDSTVLKFNVTGKTWSCN